MLRALCVVILNDRLDCFEDAILENDLIAALLAYLKLLYFIHSETLPSQQQQLSHSFSSHTSVYFHGKRLHCTTFPL